jgi:hypothetical protein
MTGEKEPTYADVAAVAGLAREVEGLRRAVERLSALPGRVEELAELVARLTETAALAGRRQAGGAPSWLDLPPDRADAAVVLAELIAWMGVVYLRYTDAAQTLPECWLWHSDVVEELLWLMHAWQLAYRSDGSSVVLAGDWHDRQRPGVVRRIKASAGTCSLENHQPGGEKHTRATPVPLAEAYGLITAWWATNREAEPPVPGEQHLAAAAALRSPRGRQ